MPFRISDHAKDELKRREISEEMLQGLLASPQQIVPNQEGRKAYQSQVEIDGKTYLLRAIVEDNTDVVITVYRTSKIQKYWSKT